MGVVENAFRCHPCEGRDPELIEITGFPPEFTLAQAGAGMTIFEKNVFSTTPVRTLKNILMPR